MIKYMDLYGAFRFFIFGVFCFLSFLVGTFVIWKKGKEEYYDQHQLFDGILGSVFWGYVGARAGFILLHFQQFGFDVTRWISLFDFPGFFGMAGIFVGFLWVVSFADKRRLDALEVADFASMGLAIALSILYIGTFFSGTGFGNATTLPVGMHFPGVYDLRHPTQLYAAVAFFVLFVVLWKLEGVYRTFFWYRSNRKTAQSGFLLSVFCIGYGCIGILLKLVSPPTVIVASIPFDIPLMVFMILVGAVTMFIRSGRTLPFSK